jgi:hypothetical protein
MIGYVRVSFWWNPDEVMRMKGLQREEKTQAAEWGKRVSEILRRSENSLGLYVRPARRKVKLKRMSPAITWKLFKICVQMLTETVWEKKFMSGRTGFGTHFSARGAWHTCPSLRVLSLRDHLLSDQLAEEVPCRPHSATPPCEPACSTTTEEEE